MATHLTMDRPSPDSAPQRPAMVLKKQIANNSPIQLKKKATEMKVLQKWNKKLLRACIPHLVYIGNEQNKE